MTTETANPIKAQPLVLDFLVLEPKPREKDTFEQIKELDDDTLFRFAYIPFVIGELLWDYADTVTLIARSLRIPATKELCRKVREYRKSYLCDHNRRVDYQRHQTELENMEVFEDAVSELTSKMIVAIRGQIRIGAPGLDKEHEDLLIAVAQYDITARALDLYVKERTEDMRRRMGHRVGDIIPRQTRIVMALIPLFLGDSGALPLFRKVGEPFARALANDMHRIELADYPVRRN